MIGQNILTLRKSRRMSQDEVAEKLQISRQAVAKWESGMSAPDIDHCVALATLFGVTLDNLVHYSEEAQHLPIPPQGKHLFGIVTISDKGQIVIPKKARDVFKLAPGDQLVVLGDEERGLALIKASTLDHFYQTLQEAPGDEK